MRVTQSSLPKLIKVRHSKPGDFVQLYDSKLNPSLLGIVMSMEAASIYNDGSSSPMAWATAPHVPQPNANASTWNDRVQILDPQTGKTTICNGSVRAHIFAGAAVVADYIEGAPAASN